MHGGATPRGTESPNFKHGLYSRYAAPALAARINELRQDEDRLHDLREVMALQGALLGEALVQGDLGAASALTEAMSRSIDRYHKHNPPQPPPPLAGQAARDQVKRLLRERRELIGEFDNPEEIHTEIDRLLGRLHQIDPNTITIIDRGNPKHGTGTGNP